MLINLSGLHNFLELPCSRYLFLYQMPYNTYSGFSTDDEWVCFLTLNHEILQKHETA
jgi:hypothetical protein